jgi:molecular chaperone DnaK
MITRAVGIDLGTTFSAIAHVNKHGVPEILHNGEGDRITPSVILFEDQEVVVGNYAKQSAVVYPERVAEFVKRRMGEKDWRFKYSGREYSPEQISAVILSKLKHDAEIRLGHRIDQAVITVPAHFGEAQRQATLEAGRLAGLEVLKLLNEPTAAAFAYGLHQRDGAKKVLVFDLGGGTFDVTLVELGTEDVRVLATDGADELGGKDWDDALIRYMAGRFEERHGMDPLEDLSAYHDLRQKCVSAKLALTRRPKVRIFFDYEGRVLREEVDRDLFERLTAGLIRRCESLALDVIDDAGITPDQVDKVLLAGGATRMPMVHDLVERLFKMPPIADINPDECVALGAALEAAILSAEAEGRPSEIGIRTHDVTSHSLGMVVYRRGCLHNSRIISKNARIPAEKSRDSYVTSHDGQTTIDLWLVQGESDDPIQCNVLGHFEFYGIPPRPAGESQLSITFRYNANGIVEVEAMDLRTGQTLPHRLSQARTTLEDLANDRAPIQMALLVDCSGSMFGNAMDDARNAAVSFIEHSLKPGRQLAIVAFPGGVFSPLSTNKTSLQEAIGRLTPFGSTPMADGLRAAQNLLGIKAGVQRVYILLTDGHPDDPDATLAEAHRIRSAGGRLITVGLGAQVQPDYLRALASSDEDYRHCETSVELRGTFINLATELEPQSEP